MSNQNFNPNNTAENNRKIALMPNVRVFYSKTGRAKYISHLDITRCMQRSLKRAGIPVWYTQGFNPHMYMTFALPLALGYESECEAMDLRLTEKVDFEKMKEDLNRALPKDIVVNKIMLQNNKPQTIAKALYEVTLVCDDKENVAKLFDEFVSQDEIIVIKKTKKGTKPMDIKPEVEIIAKDFVENGIKYTMKTTAGQKNVNPTLLTDLFVEKMNVDIKATLILRKQIYMDNGEIFE